MLNFHCWKLAANFIKHCLQASPCRRDKLRILDWAYYPLLHNNVTYLCIFIGCWPWSMKAHTQMASNPRQITSADLFSFLHARKFFNKPFEFLLYKTYRLHFSVYVCTVIDHWRRHSVERTTVTPLDIVSSRTFFVLYTLWHHLWSITVHTRKK